MTPEALLAVMVAAQAGDVGNMRFDRPEVLDLNRPGLTGGQNSRRIAHYGTDTKEQDREAVFT